MLMCSVFASFWLGNLTIDLMIGVRSATVCIRDQTGSVRLWVEVATLRPAGERPMFGGPPQAYCMTYMRSEHCLGYIIVLLCEKGACYICACCNLKLSLQACWLSDPRPDVCLLISQLWALGAGRLF